MNEIDDRETAHAQTCELDPPHSVLACPDNPVPLFANFNAWATATVAAEGGRSPIGWEARCDKCGGTFNPSGDELVTTDGAGVVRVEHYQTDDEQECGGFGPIVGSWR